MSFSYISLYFSILLSILSTGANAQEGKMIKGAIIQDGTSTRVESVRVLNQKSGRVVRSDGFGLFQLFVSLGDTLVFEKIGYQDQKYALIDFNDLIIKLKLSNQLTEVKITGTRKSSELFKESGDAYAKQQGIFYGGKPPIALLSPFGGSPATFFYELFSKHGKRVKRLNQLAETSAIDEEIAIRFNNAMIKRVVPIKDEDLDEFKNKYKPKLEKLKLWSDFELMEYIKKSFVSFKR